MEESFEDLGLSDDSDDGLDGSSSVENPTKEKESKIKTTKKTKTTKKKKKKKKKRISLQKCLFEIVNICAAEIGWKEVPPIRKWWEDCDVAWPQVSCSMTDLIGIPLPRNIHDIPKPYLLRIPNMCSFLRKCELFGHLNRMQEVVCGVDGEEWVSFYPRTWITDSGTSFDDDARWKAGEFYIYKPDEGAQGDGIVIFEGSDGKKGSGLSLRHSGVIQRYVGKTLTWGGFKFDLRLYALIFSVEPLILFVHRQGLVRLATKPYEAPSRENIRMMYLHLTNYSLNKMSDTFEESESKRTLQDLLDDSNFHVDGKRIDEGVFWEEVKGIVGKTVIAMLPFLRLNDREMQRSFTVPGGRAFRAVQIIGFDLMMDEHGKLWLLEANNSPSLRTDFEVDTKIKKPVVKDMLQIVNCDINHQEFLPSLAFRADGMDEEWMDIAGDYMRVNTDGILARFPRLDVMADASILDDFIDCCGIANRGEGLSSIGFRKFFKRRVSNSLSTTEIDLLFTKTTRKDGSRFVSFDRILDMMVEWMAEDAESS